MTETPALRPATAAEGLYVYTQSRQLAMQTGCVGHLRADMDRDGDGFFSTWTDADAKLKTEEFRREFDGVVNALRAGGDPGGALASRGDMARFCLASPQARMDPGGQDYAFRLDTEKYSYLLRLNPSPGAYNVYCYCYLREWLDGHMKKAERGIRFITPAYMDRFRLKDGGLLRVSGPGREARIWTCRYIDEYHFQKGPRDDGIVHICDFAEKLERAGAKAEPAGPSQAVWTKNAARSGYAR